VFLSSIWLLNDHPQLVRERLRVALQGRLEVRDSLPDKFDPRRQPPCITVVGDGESGGVGYGRELVRISVHAADKVRARKLLSIIDGVMLNPSIIGWFFGVQPAGGLIVHNDSKKGGAVASTLYKITTSKETR